jgi:hypothetical protein
MKVSSFVSILAKRTDGTVLVTGNFQRRPTVEVLQESDTTVQAIPI